MQGVQPASHADDEVSMSESLATPPNDGAGADGAVVFRRKLSRAQLLKFIAAQSPCIVAMEACASAHHWGRAIGELPKFDTSEANLPWLVCAGHVVSMA